MTPSYAAQRTFVSGAGNDVTATCGFNDPCRSFTRALAATDPGGEIVVKDSAGYGPVAIAKSVSIIAPSGVHAGITVFSGDGIDISGSAVKVVLRGLDIGSLGFTFTKGMNFTGSGTLHIENCVVGNHDVGLAFNPSAASKLFIRHSEFRENFSYNVQITGAAKADIYRSRFIAGDTGISASGGAAVAIFDSVVAGNGTYGVYGESFGGISTIAVMNSAVSGGETGIIANGGPIVISDSMIFNTGTGLVSTQGGTLTASGNILVNDTTAFIVSNSVMYSLGNNVFDNTSANFGLLSPLGGH